MDAAQAADKEYQRALKTANDKQTRYYETEMPSILELFQNFEEERLGFLKGVFRRIAEIHDTLPEAFKICTAEYIQVSEDVTVSGDIQEYIEENLVSVVAPTPLEYAPYETDNPNFKMDAPEISFVTTKAPMDFNGQTESSQPKYYGLTDQEEVKLSKDEKITKLQSQITELQEIIKAEISSKKGMEKLVKFYAKDPKSQEKSAADLEEQKQKISTLKKTRRGLEKQLTELDGPAPVPADPVAEQTPIVAPTPVAIQKAYVCKARALYNYDATNESELSFRGNDILLITEQDASGWWFAELNGKSGFIPSNYMEVLP